MSAIPNNLKDLVNRGAFVSFASLANARSCAEHAAKPKRIVQGDIDEDGGRFWVVAHADAQRLERAGYEIVG